MSMTSKFASIVFKARKKLDYTQSEVAEAISVSLRWYQKIESGTPMPAVWVSNGGLY